MTEKLLEERGELELAYSEANEALESARTNANEAANAVRGFDVEHPEIMEAVKQVLNDRRRVESPAAIAAGEAAIAAAETGDET